MFSRFSNSGSWVPCPVLSRCCYVLPYPIEHPPYQSPCTKRRVFTVVTSVIGANYLHNCGRDCRKQDSGQAYTGEMVIPEGGKKVPLK